MGQVPSLLWYATFSRLGEKPSLASFPPARGRGLHFLLPNRGEGRRLVPSNALPAAELAEGFAAGIVSGPLPGNGSGRRDATMAELPKMPVEELSRHL
jgi:hypothetical protein